MKRIVATLALICVCHASFADTSGDWTYTVSNNQATITGYTGAGGALTIPSELGGYAVKQVGNGWPPVFGYQNTSVTSVIIPNSVTTIGDYAFSNCTGLTGTLTIPNSVTSIGISAFAGCTGLTSITIPNSVKTIRDRAFQMCFSISQIIIPEGVESIGSAAFYLTGITEIELPQTMKYVGASAFVGRRNNPNGDHGGGEFGYYDIVGVEKLIIPDHLGAYVVGMTMYDYEGGVKIPIPLIVTKPSSARYATDTDFVETLANNDVFITAVANKIISKVGHYGLATQNGLSSAIEPLATKTQITTAINEGRAAGIASVTASPNTWSLFTSSQIQNMAIGDLVLTREVNGNFVLNYDIEQSNDLANWTVYSANTQIVRLPADKAFVRIKAKQ